MYLEKRLATENKKSIVDHFDWIAGTSTGAILTLALATGTSLLDCLRLYIRLKDEIFVGNLHDSRKLQIWQFCQNPKNHGFRSFDEIWRLFGFLRSR